ncbi:MAG: hypothetical protein KF878_10030 [Planctomycetes bacterium]|nr:hypothetical protein [Planctomycetota bacterium]
MAACTYPSSPGLLVVLLAVFGATTASAQDITLPPLPLDDRRGVEATPWLTLKPYLRTGAYYTNNVFQQRSARRAGDTIFYAIPGLDAYLEGSGGWIEVGYAPTFLAFARHGGSDTVEHRLRYVGQAEVGALTVNSSGTANWAVFNTDPQFTGRVRNFQGATNLDLDYAFTPLLGAKATAFAAESRNFPDVLEPTNTQEWGGGSYATVSPNLRQPLKLIVGSTFREIHYMDQRARLPDLSLAGAVAGAKLEVDEWLRVDLLAGVEVPWVKKRNGLSRDVDLDPGPIVNLTATLIPVEGTTLLVALRHRLEASAAAAYQRATTLSATLTQALPYDLELQLVASWRHQDPRRRAELRTQSYRATLAWKPWEHVELGVQAGYTRSDVRNGGFEAMTLGAALTLKL